MEYMDQLYEKMREFVIGAHRAKGSGDMVRHREISLQHCERTVYWLKELRPDADEAMRIAAIAHDIERALQDAPEYQGASVRHGGFRNGEYLREHQDRSAAIAAEFLESQGAPPQTVQRVRDLIARDNDQNALKDADSIAHLEISAPYFLETVVYEVGPERVREKWDWMYGRITSEQAKQIARPFYEKVVAGLKDVNGSR